MCWISWWQRLSQATLQTPHQHTKIILFIFLFLEHIQKEVLDDKAPLSGHYPSPSALRPQSRARVCLRSWSHFSQSGSYSSEFWRSSLILKTSLKYATRSSFFSSDFPSRRLAKYGHHITWLCVSMFPHSEHFHRFIAFLLSLCWFIRTSLVGGLNIRDEVKRRRRVGV